MDNYLDELISQSKSLKYTQNNFITDNTLKFYNEGYAAPELYDSPVKWIEEYVKFGGNKTKASSLNSRLQQLIDLSGQNGNFLEIVKIISLSNDDNIIWKIEDYYKSSNNQWDAFSFSVVITLLSQIMKDNKFVIKWINEHSDGWMKPYNIPKT
jgi:hypothetical protein